jgi:hypothetical protein
MTPTNQPDAAAIASAGGSTMSHTHRSLARVAAPALGVLALISLASCSSDDKEADTTTTTVETSTTTTGGESAATIAFDEEIQRELADVGCYTGADDGIIGPETDAAILAFQSASGLETDGELGPDTEAALTKAVDAGEKVCDGSTTTTTPGTTTTTAAGGGEAPCTATAISAAMGDEALASYVCADGYAAGSVAGTETATFILQSDDGRWVEVTTDPCGTASAGIPAAILEAGCEA